MYFNVYSDTGSEIQGYLIPDGFSASPSVVVRCQGLAHGPFECDIFLEGPYKYKHHETGIVGFFLDEVKIPGLSVAQDVEIADSQTGFIFYRRFDNERHLEKRIFRLETQFVPHRELDNSLKPFFQFYADGIELLGSETVRQTLEIANQSSTYVSGRVLMKNVQQYLTDDTIRVTSLRDPFYEFAVRLWTIASHKKRRFSFVSERDEIIFDPAMSYFADTNFSKPEAIKAKLKFAPREILALFESPFTHQLVASSPTDKVSRDAVSTALDVLSQFTIFNPNESDESLATDIVEFLQIDGSSVRFTPVRSPFLELAEVLREVNAVEHVLENDLILSHFIKRAAGRAYDHPI